MKIKDETLLLGLIGILIAALVVNQYLISNIQSAFKGTASPAGKAVSQTGGGNNANLEAILADVVPKGVPEYGGAADVSFDKVDNSLQTLVGYHTNMQLSGSDQERYIKIGMTKETACEFCCGIGELGFADKNGNLLCGCAHTIALSGLTKWLIKNSDYTDEQIVEAIKDWKGVFFPAPMVSKELARRGINPETVGLPSIQGGC